MRAEKSSNFLAYRPSANVAHHVAVVGNFPPTKCGIATFTADMVASLRTAAADIQLDIYAMAGSGTDPCLASICSAIPSLDRAAYAAAGRRIDVSGAGLVWLQHEFGIFGGDAGDWVIDLLTPVAAPLVVTFHTVLSHPTAAQRRVVDWLVNRSVRLVVMSKHSARLLQEVYGAKAECVASSRMVSPTDPLAA